MINFIAKKVNDKSPFYNITLMKMVHKRSGEIVEEPGDTFYGVPLDIIRNRITCENLSAIDREVSLKEYFILFNESYKEVCELLKKIL